MASAIDFLKQSVREVRKSIKDIDDSYNNEWDIIAELTQNAVDAIKASNRQDGEIEIKIDCQNKVISIKDNGSGIDPTKLPILLRPFSTDKDDDENSIGEKGVGLTFVIFSCNDFYIKSGTKNGTSEGKIIDAHSWKNSLTTEPLHLYHEKLDENFSGTQVILKKVSDVPIFRLSFKQIEFVLRTRTAIGNTIPVWLNDFNIKVKLIYVNQDGVPNEKDVKFKYWLPIEDINGKGTVDIREFNEWNKEKDRTDYDKRLKLKDKIVYKYDEFIYSGRTIRAFSCLVPKRKSWEDLTQHFNIATKDNLENSDWVDQNNFTIFQSGIFISVKGMPTGVTISHPVTGTAAVWPQIFILFEDRGIKFDIGRKSIHGMQARVLKGFAREIFSNYQRLAKYISGEIQTNATWERDEIFAEIHKRIDLSAPGTKFRKNPDDQEASVAGVFFECIGNGRLIGITPLIAGYREKYDLYALWNTRNVVIEFKSKLSKILKDFSDVRKFFDEINCVVAWNVDDIDRQAFSNEGIEVEEIVRNPVPGIVDQNFPNSTHKLLLSGYVHPVYVIDMKRIVS